MRGRRGLLAGTSSDTLGDYWPGLTDLMAGLLLIFVFLTVFAQVRGTLATEDIRAAEERTRRAEEESQRREEETRRIQAEAAAAQQAIERELEDARRARGQAEEKREKAENALRQAGVVQLEVEEELAHLNEWKAAVQSLCQDPDLRQMNVNVDCQTGAIELPERVFFGFNEEELTDEGRESLRGAMPLILDRLRGAERLWTRVSVVEVRGHADPRVRHGLAYDTNLRKSQGRAFEVLQFLTADSQVPAADRAWFERMGVASGVAHKRPPVGCELLETEECHSAMRRVELLIGFDDQDVRRRFDDLLIKVGDAFRGLEQ